MIRSETVSGVKGLMPRDTEDGENEKGSEHEDLGTLDRGRVEFI